MSKLQIGNRVTLVKHDNEFTIQPVGLRGIIDKITSDLARVKFDDGTVGIFDREGDDRIRRIDQFQVTWTLPSDDLLGGDTQAEVTLTSSGGATVNLTVPWADLEPLIDAANGLWKSAAILSAYGAAK